MKVNTNIQNSVTADEVVTEVLGDTYDDQGILREKCYRWLFRVWTRLNLSLFRTKREVYLPIAAGTKTLMLPPDYHDLVFLGFNDEFGNRFPITVNRNLAPQLGVEGNDVCNVCGQTDLCSTPLDMQQTDETVMMDGGPFTKTTTRIIQPDGSYTEEITEPVRIYQESQPPPFFLVSEGSNGAAAFILVNGVPQEGDIGLLILEAGMNLWQLSATGHTDLGSMLQDLKGQATAKGFTVVNYDIAPDFGLQFTWPGQPATSALIITLAPLVVMQTSRRVVCTLPDSCTGCVPATPGNLQMLAACGCTDAICMCGSGDMLPYPVLPGDTSYNLFEQEGFIQFNPGCCLTGTIVKYVSTGVCIQGVWYFPLAAFECLISGTYYRMIEKKKNVGLGEKDRARRAYTAERKDLLRDFTKLNYQEWLELLDTIPRIPSL